MSKIVSIYLVNYLGVKVVSIAKGGMTLLETVTQNMKDI